MGGGEPSSMMAFAAVMPSLNSKLNTDWPVKATAGPANFKKKSEI